MAVGWLDETKADLWWTRRHVVAANKTINIYIARDSVADEHSWRAFSVDLFLSGDVGRSRRTIHVYVYRKVSSSASPAS